MTETTATRSDMTIWLARCESCGQIARDERGIYDDPMHGGRFFAIYCDCGGKFGKWKGGVVVPEKVCDGRCLNAKRETCFCSCGGSKHGTGARQS